MGWVSGPVEGPLEGGTIHLVVGGRSHNPVPGDGDLGDGCVGNVVVGGSAGFGAGRRPGVLGRTEPGAGRSIDPDPGSTYFGTTGLGAIEPGGAVAGALFGGAGLAGRVSGVLGRVEGATGTVVGLVVAFGDRGTWANTGAGNSCGNDPSNVRPTTMGDNPRSMAPDVIVPSSNLSLLATTNANHNQSCCGRKSAQPA